MVNRSRDIVNNDGINQLTEFSWIPNSKLDERWVNQRRWSDGNEALIETDWGKKRAGTGASAPFSIGWPMKNCHQLIDTLKSQQLIMSRDLLSIDKWSWKWKELRWWSEWTRRCQVLTNCPRFFQSNNNENNKEKNLGSSRWNRFSWPLILFSLLDGEKSRPRWTVTCPLNSIDVSLLWRPIRARAGDHASRPVGGACAVTREPVHRWRGAICCVTCAPGDVIGIDELMMTSLTSLTSQRALRRGFCGRWFIFSWRLSAWYSIPSLPLVQSTLSAATPFPSIWLSIWIRFDSIRLGSIGLNQLMLNWNSIGLNWTGLMGMDHTRLEKWAWLDWLNPLQLGLKKIVICQFYTNQITLMVDPAWTWIREDCPLNSK